MRLFTRILTPSLLVIGMLCIAASFAIAQDDDDSAQPEPTTTEEVEVTPEAETESDSDETATNENLGLLDDDIVIAIEPTGNNGYCSICHSQPLRTVQLGDGTLLNLFVNPGLITGSVHGPTADSPGLGCLDCHGEDSFPHVGAPPEDRRLYTLEMNSLCTDCHVTQAEDLSTGLHAMAISDGNTAAAVCTDCHDAHHVQSVENFPDLVAGVCGDCHTDTLVDWQISPHAGIGPLGCASCHDYHAQTLRVGETTTDLCVNCHGDMEPVFAHETHLEVDNPVECADCHMYTGHSDQLLSTLEVGTSGHSMMLDSTPCTTCHSQLVSSGEWDQIISARFDLDGDAETSTDVEAAQVEDDHGEDDGNDDTVSILQGLLVGLGLGITFTIVFVTRSVRRNASA